MKTYSAIVATAKNRVIGLQGKMPWHLPEDLRYFKKITLGQTVIMGRKTFESIGKPLPQRTNVVISHDTTYAPAGTVNFQTWSLNHSEESAFIIGGGQIYKKFWPLLTKIYLTEIDITPDGDTYFPTLDTQEFNLKNPDEAWLTSEGGLRYRFLIYERLQS